MAWIFHAVLISTCSRKLVAFEFGVRSNFDRRSVALRYQ
jgi:hypothetical protein